MSKDFDFLAAAKALTPKNTLTLDELGVTIEVHGLTAREINAANKAATKVKAKGRNGKPDEVEVDGEKLTASLLALSLYTVAGDRLVPQGRESEVFDLPHALVGRLTKAVFEINGMTPPKEDAEGNA